MSNRPVLTAEQASEFARLALKGVRTEYPNMLSHVLTGPLDLRSPKSLHPTFYGCYDWHSSVHSHWMLVRLLRVMPNLPEAREIRSVLAEHLTADKLRVEKEYLDRPTSRSFERTYGWAWLLKLAQELHTWDDPQAKEWSRNLQPLAGAFVECYLEFLPKQTYPIRGGTHPNTAFGLTFAYDYARPRCEQRLKSLVVARSLDYYAQDTDAPARWEPAGSDFLSPCLVEAELMRRVLPQVGFPSWLNSFLPGLEHGEPETLLTPAHVSDRSDPQIVHLDGLNLSRAWCMSGIASALPADSPARKVLTESAARHLEAALPHISSGDYMGEHWLASFAVYALTLSA